MIHLWVNYPFKEKAVCVKASVKVSELPTPKLACGVSPVKKTGEGIFSI